MTQGFTLIEILLAIGIVSLLAIGAVSAFLVFRPGLQLNGAIQELIGDLRYAQQSAVTEQKEYCLQFWPVEKKYYLKRCDGEIIKEKTLSSEIISLTVNGFTNNEIRYNPYGAVKEAGSIILENIENKQKTISIKPSGFIRLSD